MIDSSLIWVSFTWCHLSRFAYVPQQNAESGCEIVLKKRSKRFQRWDMELHFGFYQQAGEHELDKSHVICKAWHTQIKYVGNTTNLRNHVSRFHPELLATTPAAENANSVPATQRIDATLFSILLANNAVCCVQTLLNKKRLFMSYYFMDRS